MKTKKNNVIYKVNCDNCDAIVCWPNEETIPDMN